VEEVVLRRLDLRGKPLATPELRDLLPRAPIDVEAALDAVRPICADVRARGAVAVREITERLDGVTLAALRVPA
jgi:histidinol dehydrogenase